MRFTNICGMTIPERMVALQEMMQSLIDAIYGEYRWTANVSHVSETNVFTATNVINFNDDDFIVGQTVLFTDCYLGVIIEVDNSKNPKQFTAGNYMEVRGPQGGKGDPGDNGVDGLNYLFNSTIFQVTNNMPPIGTSISFPISTFNRTPVIGDEFIAMGRNTSSNKTFLVNCKVTSITSGTQANCKLISFIETTGPGLTKKYMHTISYTPESIEDEPVIRIVIFSSDDNIIGDFSDLIEFFNENGYMYEDVSYPATGAYKDADVVYNVWGIYYNDGEGSFYAQYGDNKVGVNAGTPSGVGLIDVIIDLGS